MHFHCVNTNFQVKGNVDVHGLITHYFTSCSSYLKIWLNFKLVCSSVQTSFWSSQERACVFIYELVLSTTSFWEKSLVYVENKFPWPISVIWNQHFCALIRPRGTSCTLVIQCFPDKAGKRKHIFVFNGICNTCWLSSWAARVRFHSFFAATESSKQLIYLPYKYAGDLSPKLC